DSFAEVLPIIKEPTGLEYGALAEETTASSEPPTTSEDATTTTVVPTTGELVPVPMATAATTPPDAGSTASSDAPPPRAVFALRDPDGTQGNQAEPSTTAPAATTSTSTPTS